MRFLINILIIAITLLSTHLRIQDNSCLNFAKKTDEICMMDCCRPKQKSCCDVNTCHTSIGITYIISETYQIDKQFIKKASKKVYSIKNGHLYDVLFKHFQPPESIHCYS